MPPISAPCPTAGPDANAATPEPAPIQRPATPGPATLHLDPLGPPPGARNGPLRSGNPRGNPNLAPRCGARAKRTGCACRAPAMANGRCRMHGGKSTGPRTPEGLARIAAARTTHGAYAQTGHDGELRASSQRGGILLRRLRLKVAVLNHLPWLPAVFVARFRADDTPELNAVPMHRTSLGYAPVAATPGSSVPPGQDARWQALVGHAPCNRRRDARGRFARAPQPVLRGRKAELAQARAEVAALAPWKAAVARARKIKRLMRLRERAALLGNRGQDPVKRLPEGACAGGGSAAGAGESEASVSAGLPACAKAGSAGMSRTEDGGGPTTTDRACGDKSLTQRGAVRAAVGGDVDGRGPARAETGSAGTTGSEDGGASATADRARGDKSLMQRGAVRAEVGGDVDGRGSARAETGTAGTTGSEDGDGPATAHCAHGDKSLMQRGAVHAEVGGDVGGRGSACSEIGSAGTTGSEDGGASATADCARGDKSLMQRGAVRPGRESGGDTAAADRKRSDKGLMQRGAVVRFGAGPFRWRRSNSTAGNDPAADELAAHAERAGEWTVVMAIQSAQQAGWHPDRRRSAPRPCRPARET
jgi:hypothetical protein